jgi:poly(3-hydroxybutyrate) depolymerase
VVLAPLPQRLAAPPADIRVVKIPYRAWDRRIRFAYVMLPRWYGARDDPPVPLVISPHGRGVPAWRNVRIWGDLPARGRFVVVNPAGQGRRLGLYSWGDPGQIRDLARMPSILRRRLPWLHIESRRIYAFGGSMGGQETLLLVAHYPRLLAGAASFDADTNFALRYSDFRWLRNGTFLQWAARDEVGGTPSTDGSAYAVRSPLDDARAIARSGVPLQLWWSNRDRIVIDQYAEQTGLLYHRIEAADPRAAVYTFVGTWAHTAEMRWNRRLPTALRLFGLLPGKVQGVGSDPPGFVQVDVGPDGGKLLRGTIPDPRVPQPLRPGYVYLPPGFEPAIRYPVVYLLHGMPGDPLEYVDSLHLAQTADQLISSNAVHPFIAVLPAAGPNVKYNGEWAGPWEEYVDRAVVPWVDAHLPTIATPAGRTLAGLSAGGYGAVDIALRSPQLFGQVESWSGYFRPLHDGPLKGTDKATLAANDPTRLVVAKAPLLRSLRTRFFLGSGPTHSHWFKEQETIDFARRLRGLQLPVTLYLVPTRKGEWYEQFVAGLRWAVPAHV